MNRIATKEVNKVLRNWSQAKYKNIKIIESKKNWIKQRDPNKNYRTATNKIQKIRLNLRNYLNNSISIRIVGKKRVGDQ